MKQLYLINEFKKKSIEDCTISAVLMGHLQTSVA